MTRINVNLFVLNIDDDIILGLTFLRMFNPVVNWRLKTVTFNSDTPRPETVFATQLLL